MNRRNLVLTLVLAGVVGCHGSALNRRTDAGRPRRLGPPIRRVACLYDQRPWLSLDQAGDRDPEGLWFRAFLDPGTGKGVLADGTFHVEMYRVDRGADGHLKRTLVSDWHYPSEDVSRIARPGMLGAGYVLQLRRADKSVIGREIEVITRFEDAGGVVAVAGTKRLRVPKYSS